MAKEVFNFDFSKEVFNANGNLTYVYDKYGDLYLRLYRKSDTKPPAEKEEERKQAHPRCRTGVRI